MNDKKIGVELRALHNTIIRSIERGRGPVSHELERITCTNGWMLAYISEQTKKGIPVYQKDIEETFSITRSTVSKVVQLLVQKGLLIQQPVAHDARLKQLLLTSDAMKLTSQMQQRTEQTELLLTSGFSEQELDFFLSCVERMKENITHYSECTK